MAPTHVSTKFLSRMFCAFLILSRRVGGVAAVLFPVWNYLLITGGSPGETGADFGRFTRRRRLPRGEITGGHLDRRALILANPARRGRRATSARLNLLLACP